jgi:hypothetical protein
MTPFGLHASADPGISDVEVQEFVDARPEVIKVLSFHPADKVRRLSALFPNAAWIVRAFLDFGGRVITPYQFVQDTVADVRRTLDAIGPKDKDHLAIELHNEPNLVAEGLGTSWDSGREFAPWWIELVARYRAVLPGIRYMYPGLSPGPVQAMVRENDLKFLQESLKAVWQSNGYGIHSYWQAGNGPASGLTIVDNYIRVFPHLRCWVTEAAKTDAGTPAQFAHDYLEFARLLATRPTVRGVTFFAASATNPDFESQTWLSYDRQANTYTSKGLGKLVGARA